MMNNPIVDRRVSTTGKFIMSLSEGEMVRMLSPETRRPGVFVVFKIDGRGVVHFAPHWDARRANGEGGVDGSKRKDIAVVASKLRDLGLAPGTPPTKVRVSPLGEIIELQRD